MAEGQRRFWNKMSKMDKEDSDHEGYDSYYAGGQLISNGQLGATLAFFCLFAEGKNLSY